MLCYNQGPVVQGVVSLTNSLRVILLTVFSGFNIQYSDMLCWKNVSSFCTAKATHIFSAKKFQHICVSLDVNFNESLTNDIVSFEQLGPVCYLTMFLSIWVLPSLGPYKLFLNGNKITPEFDWSPQMLFLFHLFYPHQVWFMCNVPVLGSTQHLRVNWLPFEKFWKFRVVFFFFFFSKGKQKQCCQS